MPIVLCFYTHHDDKESGQPVKVPVWRILESPIHVHQGMTLHCRLKMRSFILAHPDFYRLLFLALLSSWQSVFLTFLFLSKIFRIHCHPRQSVDFVLLMAFPGLSHPSQC